MQECLLFVHVHRMYADKEIRAHTVLYHVLLERADLKNSHHPD